MESKKTNKKPSFPEKRERRIDVIVKNVKSMPQEEARDYLKNIFSDLYKEDGDGNEIIEQVFRKPNMFTMPITKVVGKMYDGQTDFSDEVGTWVNVGTAKRPALVDTKMFVSVLTDDGFEVSSNLSPYDREVFNGICSLIESGQTVFTPKQIYEAFAGKSTTSQAAIEQVVQSVNKQRMALVSVDWSEHAKMNGLVLDDDDCVHVNENMLHMRAVKVRCNGQETFGFQLLESPLLYRYAKTVGQICTVDKKLLQVKVSNTDDSILLKNHMLRRVEQMKNIKTKSSNIIRFDRMYEACGIKNDKIQAKRKRETVTAILSDWVNDGYIKGYELIKEGSVYVSIGIEL